MAAYDIIFADPGGEYYFSVGMGAPGIWTGGAGGTSLINNALAGRATTYAINPAGSTFTRNFSSFQSWIVGHAHNVSSIGSNVILQSFKDSGTVQVDVRTTITGQLQVTRNGTPLGTSTNLIAPGGWHCIEFKAIIASGTGGSVEVKVDSVVWLTITGVNTQSTANASANQVSFQGVSGDQYKDIYIMADTGTGPYTTYLGDVTVPVLYPNGAGVNQQWTPNTGTQTAAVQDGTTHTGTWPDGDTTYISDSTAGHISDFAHQALSLTGTIYGVVHASYMRKDDAGSRAVRQVCLSGVTTEDNGSDLSLGNSYQYYFDVIQEDPHTGAQWTVTNFNNATFGVKEIS